MLRGLLYYIPATAVSYAVFYFLTPLLMDALAVLPMVGMTRIYEVYVALILAEILTMVVVASLIWFISRRNLPFTILVSVSCISLHIATIVYYYYQTPAS